MANGDFLASEWEEIIKNPSANNNFALHFPFIHWIAKQLFKTHKKRKEKKNEWLKCCEPKPQMNRNGNEYVRRV